MGGSEYRSKFNGFNGKWRYLRAGIKEKEMGVGKKNDEGGEENGRGKVGMRRKAC